MSPLYAFAPTLLAGKVAFVTGSTSGIGLRTAEQLAAAGATVILNGRSMQGGEAALAALLDNVPDAKASFLPADYTRADQLDDLFARIAQEHVGLDILCHTTMVEEGGGPRPFMDTTPDDWDAVLRGIFLSLLHVTRRAVPMMIARGGGAIVSFASDAAKVATPGETVLGGALAGNCMFVRSAALELARHNIRVNAVTPSITRGTRTYDRVMAGGFSKALFEKAERRARLGVAHAENVAPMAVFLASPLASHITGQVVSVNGGISAA